MCYIIIENKQVFLLYMHVCFLTRDVKKDSVTYLNVRE